MGRSSYLAAPKHEEPLEALEKVQAGAVLLKFGRQGGGVCGVLLAWGPGPTVCPHRRLPG
jgi:hypothetical protein